MHTCQPQWSRGNSGLDSLTKGSRIVKVTFIFLSLKTDYLFNISPRVMIWVCFFFTKFKRKISVSLSETTHCSTQRVIYYFIEDRALCLTIEQLYESLFTWFCQEKKTFWKKSPSNIKIIAKFEKEQTRNDANGCYLATQVDLN